MNNNSLINVGGLWQKQSKKGTQYLSGVIKAGSIPGLTSDWNVMLFNRQPRHDDDPNKSYPLYNICVSAKDNVPQPPQPTYNQQWQ